MSRTVTTTLLLPIVALGVALLTSSPIEAQDADEPPQQMPTPVPREFDVPEEAPIPDDLEIVVIREDLIPGQFRILDVRLSRAVDEQVLTTIANVLRDDDEATYQRTYIVYILPGMEPGAGGWATSHFTPDLEVRILEPAR